MDAEHFRNFSPKHQRQAAARFDREAKQVQADAAKRQTAENVERNCVKTLADVNNYRRLLARELTDTQRAGVQELLDLALYRAKKLGLDVTNPIQLSTSTETL